MTSLFLWTLLSLLILAWEWWQMQPDSTPPCPPDENPLDWDEWWNDR